MDEDCPLLLRQAMDTPGLSPRAYEKVLKVARTIADLMGENRILPHHLTESVNYRTLDRRLE